MRSLYHLLILFLSGLFFINVQTLSAQVVQDERKVSSFENVVISTTENTYVHISYDKSHKITVKADGRTIQKVKTTICGDTLTVHLRPEDVGNAKIEIYIKVPRVKHVTIAGSGRVEVVDGLNTGNLQV